MMIEDILQRFKIPRFSKKPSYAIGLDIGSTYAKLVELQRKDGLVQLRKASFAAINSEAGLADSISTFLKSQEIAAGQVNISLSGAAVVMRFITLPRMNQQELKGAVQFEAKKLIPFPLEDIILDYAVTQENAKDNKIQVVLAAAKKTLVQERIQLLERSGLTAQTIDLDCFCLTNAFTHFYLPPGRQEQDKKSETIGLLNIGARLTNLVILENGSLKFSRDIGFGCQEAALANLSAEIGSSIDYYENQIGLPVEKIYLSGGASLMPSVRESVASHLDVALVDFDVFSALEMDPALHKEELIAKQRMFAVALGLALR